MTIGDLRGRENEREVLALLEPEPAWTVVGCQRDEQLVACAAIERTSDDELTVRALGAHADLDARRAPRCDCGGRDRVTHRLRSER